MLNYIWLNKSCETTFVASRGSMVRAHRNSHYRIVGLPASRDIAIIVFGQGKTTARSIFCVLFVDLPLWKVF